MTTTVQIATGAYTSFGGATGVRLLELSLPDGADGAPTVRELAQIPATDPSYVRWSEDGTLLYAVQETSPAHLLAIRVPEQGTGAELAGELTLQGSGACHVALGRPGTLLVADYGSGHVETVSLDAEGLPVEVIDVEDHHDNADGADPHPHQVRPLDRTDLLAVPDLGLDHVYLYRQDSVGRLGLDGQIAFPRGSGPRHFAADHESQHLFVACELNGSIALAVRAEVPEPSAGLQVMRPAQHEWSVRASVTASGGAEENAVSHIELTADEHHLLVANRGPDSLSLFSLAGMRPERVAEVSVGAHPRHFTQIGEHVLVAAQHAGRIDVLRRAGDELAALPGGIDAPGVSCIAPRP